MTHKLTTKGPQLTEDPCPRCKPLVDEGSLRVEALQPPPKGAWAPLDAIDNEPCCFDCASADALMRFQKLDFLPARIAVANDRQEQLRLPGAQIGLVQMGLVRPSAEGDLERHLKWLDRIGYSSKGLS